jgi:hypothetical protein
MKKRSVRKTGGGSRRSADAQVAEFGRRDLGDDIRCANGAASAGALEAHFDRARRRPRPATPREGCQARARYQTMLKMIVREHLDEY